MMSDEYCLKEFINRNIGVIWYAKCPRCGNPQPGYKINGARVDCDKCGTDLFIKVPACITASEDESCDTIESVMACDFKEAAIFGLIFAAVSSLSFFVIMFLSGNM